MGNPVAEKLLAFLMEHEKDARSALERAERQCGLAPDRVGLVVGYGSVFVMERAKLWAMAASIQLGIGTPMPRCVPVLISHDRLAAVAWFGPVGPELPGGPS